MYRLNGLVPVAALAASMWPETAWIMSFVQLKKDTAVRATRPALYRPEFGEGCVGGDIRTKGFTQGVAPPGTILVLPEVAKLVALPVVFVVSSGWWLSGSGWGPASQHGGLATLEAGVSASQRPGVAGVAVRGV